MLVSEQLDAMRALGTDPIKKLVVPRLLGCMIMTPRCHNRVVVAHWELGDCQIDSRHCKSVYTSSAKSRSITTTLWVRCKSATFGMIIAIIGCRTDYEPMAEPLGVGRSTTQSVVASIVTILITDFFLQKLIMALKSGRRLLAEVAQTFSLCWSRGPASP